MPSNSSFSRRALLATGIGAVAWAADSGRENPQDLAALTLKKASELVRRKTVSPVDLTQACLKRIEQYNLLVNAFITISEESALATARSRESEAQRGNWRGPLHGIPIALKDNIDTAGVRTTGASELFKDRVPTEDAEVVRRLKSAGAVILGKLNMHEFAYGGTSVVTYFGPVGTDTAGSVRIPASYCSMVGFKPTYGRVSNRGVIPLSWTLDHVGPMCRTVEDAALMLGSLPAMTNRTLLR